MKYVSVWILFTLYFSERALADLLIANYEGDYYSVNSATGRANFLASSPFITSVNFQVALNSSTALVYKLTDFNGVRGIGITNLKSAQSLFITDSASPYFSGFYRDTLIADYGGNYHAFNPSSGKGALLASTAFTATINFQVDLDVVNGWAYKLTLFNNIRGVGVTNLNSGSSLFIPEPEVQAFAGFYNGQLITNYAGSYYTFDPFAGKGLLLAASPFATLVNGQLDLDESTGMVYKATQFDGVPGVGITDLNSGFSHFIPEIQPPLFAGFIAVPEPAHYASAAAVLSLLLCLGARLRRPIVKRSAEEVGRRGQT